MSKKRFIQGIIIRSLPEIEKLPQAINYGESLWDGLSEKGYGADKPHQPRENKDWYKALSERQRRWFNGFWAAFNYKRDRNEAATRWAQLGEMTDAEYQFIIDAAKKESLKQLPQGIARKRAPGWLHSRRYDDYQPTKKSKNAVKSHVLIGLNNQLNAIKKLYKSSKDQALLPQIQKLEQAIRDARG
jgi:hypothetical protein